MRYFREIYGKSTLYIKKHEMLASEDGVMVGLSGGKDSLTLLQVLSSFLRHSKYKYPLAAGHIDLGMGADIQPLKDFCQTLDIPLFVEKTDIGPIIFDVRKESNPCALCAKMRRGALNALAKKNGYTKIALGHHQDDYVETFLLSTFFEGRIGSFKPVTYLDRMEVTVIRPLMAVPERLIIQHAANADLPIVKNLCPANGYTKRNEMKRLLKDVESVSPMGKELAFRALERSLCE